MHKKSRFEILKFSLCTKWYQWKITEMPKNILNLRLLSKDISIAALNNSKEWIGFLKIIFSKITFTKKVHTRSCAQRVFISVCHVTLILIFYWSFSYNTEVWLACIHVTSYQRPYKRALPGAKYQKFKKYLKSFKN